MEVILKKIFFQFFGSFSEKKVFLTFLEDLVKNMFFGSFSEKKFFLKNFEKLKKKKKKKKKKKSFFFLF